MRKILGKPILSKINSLCVRFPSQKKWINKKLIIKKGGIFLEAGKRKENTENKRNFASR